MLDDWILHNDNSVYVLLFKSFLLFLCSEKMSQLYQGRIQPSPKEGVPTLWVATFAAKS